MLGAAIVVNCTGIKRTPEKVADMTKRLVDEGDARRRAENELVEVRREVAEKEARFNNRIAEMESRMDTMRQEHAATLLAERRARTDELEMVHRTHETELADRDMEISTLKRELGESSANLASVRNERAELAGKASQLDLENKRLHDHVQDLQGQLRVAGQERAAAEAKALVQEEFRIAETTRAESLSGELNAAHLQIGKLEDIIAVTKARPDGRPG
jgi:chromosome segregation ATPase